MLQRRVSLPGAVGSTRRARSILRSWLTEAGAATTADEDLDTTIAEDMAADAVLLASELTENAVLHAGTGFEMVMTITGSALSITVTDHGVHPLERYLSAPRPTTGRAATHGRGLLLLERMSDAWGTRHDRAGHHTWFQLNRPCPASSLSEATAQPAETSPADAEPSAASDGNQWPPPQSVRRLLHLTQRLIDELSLPEQLTELLRRLSEISEVTAAAVSVDYDDGQGERLLATTGPHDRHGLEATEIDLPLPAPLRGRLTLGEAGEPGLVVPDLAELCARRIALAIQSDWLTGVDHRQRAWTNYLSEASELLSEPRELDLTVAIVPQIVVPRLGPWCVIHTYDSTNRLHVAALTHLDEDQIEHLRTAMSGTLAEELKRLGRLVEGPARYHLGARPFVALPLVSPDRVHGVISVSCPDGRTHTPEEILVLRDLARRASNAIDNALYLGEHKASSQALQRALLPRGMPAAPGIEFSADYLPASPASAVGGDFYGVLELTRDARWLSFIGDVCGKGPAAAARTAVVREVLGVLVRDGRPLLQALETLNTVLLETRDPYQFCTLAAALISYPESTHPPGLDITLVLAGHEPLVLLRAGGGAELVGAPGTALGILPTITLKPTQVHLDPGDSLIAYTDGVVEQRRLLPSGRSEQFGHTRLLQSAREAVDLPGAHIISHISDTVADFGPQPQYDDIALLVVRATAESPDEATPPVGVTAHDDASKHVEHCTTGGIDVSAEGAELVS